MAPARGRAIVGRHSGGTLRGAIGTPLSDLENRTHFHNVNPAAVTSSLRNSHTHSVDPPNSRTTWDSHNHAWSQYKKGGWVGYDSRGNPELLTNWGNGIGAEGSGWDSFSVHNGHTFANFYTLSDTHDHTLNIGPFQSGLNGGHGQTVDVPATNSSSASTAHVLPYVQLLACRKD